MAQQSNGTAAVRDILVVKKEKLFLVVPLSEGSSSASQKSVQDVCMYNI